MTRSTSVVVLGAGMVGICTALQLAQRGHAVTLVDRREPGRETSYGNAGLIQREAVEPYAFPRQPGTLARIALKRGVDVNYHFSALAGLARAALRLIDPPPSVVVVARAGDKSALGLAAAALMAPST